MCKSYVTKQCESPKEFWGLISPERESRNKSKLIYRGQGNDSWKLRPSLLRDNSIIKKKISCSDEVSTEIMLLNMFIEQCDMMGLSVINDSYNFRKTHKIGSDFYNQYLLNPEIWPDENLFDLMALAQHHGIPTRLLDWSWRSHVAAYFAASQALHEQQQGDFDIAVWALDTTKILPKSIIFIKSPGSTTSNIAAQSGLFTYLRQPGKRDDVFKAKNLEDEFVSYTRTPLQKITLSVKYAPDILKLCELYGVTAATLFPDYNGAAKAVLEKLNVNDKKKYPSVF